MDYQASVKAWAEKYIRYALKGGSYSLDGWLDRQSSYFSKSMRRDIEKYIRSLI